MTQPEFVRLNGQAVRVSSLKRDADSGTIDLVIVARGSSATQALTELGNSPTLSMEIPDQSAERYNVSNTDFRTTGTGEQIMNRIRLTLDPAMESDMTTAEPETQLDRIERKLDDLLASFRNHRT